MFKNKSVLISAFLLSLSSLCNGKNSTEFLPMLSKPLSSFLIPFNSLLKGNDHISFQPMVANPIDSFSAELNDSLNSQNRSSSQPMLSKPLDSFLTRLKESINATDKIVSKSVSSKTLNTVTKPSNASVVSKENLKHPYAIPGWPRLALYHQTHRHKGGGFNHSISLLPLLNNTRLTHIYIGAWHLHTPEIIKLNDHLPDDVYHDELWEDVRTFRMKRPDVKFYAMLGGAAGKFFNKLHPVGNPQWKAFYFQICKIIMNYGFDGVDLDVEEPIHQSVIENLINLLKHDFGANFEITLAPVLPAMLSYRNAAAVYKEGLPPLPISLTGFERRPLPRPPHPPKKLVPEPILEADWSPITREHPVPPDFYTSKVLPAYADSFGGRNLARRNEVCGNLNAKRGVGRARRVRRNLSGFDYLDLYATAAGQQVDFFNVQMYCGWGSATDVVSLDNIALSFPVDKIVLGVLTHVKLGTGAADPFLVGEVIRRHMRVYGLNFGGVFGWEYYNPSGGNHEAWAMIMECYLNGGSSDECQAGGNGLDANGLPKFLGERQYPAHLDVFPIVY